MTKTLTEQWKNGKLTFGKMYWCCDKEKNIAKLVNINSKFFEWDIATEVTKDVKEVLAPVPNYEEHKQLVSKTEQLEKKLGIATKALKRIDPPNINFEDHNNRAIELWEIAHKALKEMEGVK